MFKEALWLEHEMQLPLNFEKCHIDPAPFQLVERTSLFKVMPSMSRPLL